MSPATAFSRERFRLLRDKHARRLICAPAEELNATAIDADVVAQTAAAAKVMEQENGELRQMIGRQRAEFDNFRRRSQKEKEQVRESAAENIVAKLLPIIDNFELALRSARESQDAVAVREGVEMIARQLNGVLEGEGLERIEALHMHFDPAVHEAIATETREGVAENTVVEVTRNGYRFKGKTVRPVSVKVAAAPLPRKPGRAPTETRRQISGSA